MKHNKFFNVLLILIIMVSISCSNNIEPDFKNYTTKQEIEESEEIEEIEEESQAGLLFQGNHKLSMVKDNKYFYLYKSTDYNTLMCSFIWETNDGYWASNYIYYTHIRFKIDSNITEPYIKFNWNRSNNQNSIQGYIQQNVNYIVIYTNNNNFQDLISYFNQLNSHPDSSD